MSDLLFIDKMIMRKVKMRKRNLSVTWIDCKKDYDMVLHSWIIDCLETVGINQKIRGILAESMKSCRVGDEEFFKVTLCHHCYLLFVCFHLHIF